MEKKIRNFLGKTIVALVGIPLVFAGCGASLKEVQSSDIAVKSCSSGSISAYKWANDFKCVGYMAGHTVLDADCDGKKVKVCDRSLPWYAVMGKQNVSTDCHGPDSSTAAKVKKDYRLCLEE